MTYDQYEKIKKLEELKANGTLTEEEFQAEKEKVINGTGQTTAATSQRQPLLGIDEKSYLLLMHLSQFISAFIIPLIMWLIGKEDSKNVDEHGKNIINFTISYFIWGVIGVITVVIGIGIVILSVMGIAVTVFIIVAAVKAYNGEYWKYPLTISFLK
ncbi:MAG: hypothetical protein H6Q19_364 [Bacteroidetes bacterium]|nr:hypothetical protein [Bacteroidota bacterium]